jgi:hypothetical protein
MRSALFWIAVGGLSFWLPFIVVGAAQPDNANVVLLNIAPLAGLILLGAISWIYTKAFPKWVWVLAGIYILGPTSMLAPSAFFYGPSSPSIPGENLWLLLVCLFPPMTLWLALLNGMIFSVLIATAILPFLRKWDF